MRQEDQLKYKYGTDAGFRVPDGYFEELNLKIMEQLPAYPEAPKMVDRSLWQRVKPYVYLAAMFAGIWLMMKVFHTVTTTESLSLDNPPAAIVQAMSEENADGFHYYSPVNDYLLEEEITTEYDNIEDFEADFGYDFKPQYASL